MKKFIVFLLMVSFVAAADGQIIKELKKKGEEIITKTIKNIKVPDNSNDKKDNKDNKKDNNLGLTTDEATRGIKEALINGVSKSSDALSALDGFYKSPDIKIPFPPQATTVESTLRKVGLGRQCDDVILSLNRAAEDASKSAKNIFVGAIQKMTVNDALKIVKGDSIAATRYLQEKTSAQLTSAFAPIIRNSLNKVNATKYWADAMNAYNKIPLVEKVNPDLTQYVTQKAMYALFLYISREETLIRKDPVARTTELLKKVFGTNF